MYIWRKHGNDVKLRENYSRWSSVDWIKTRLEIEHKIEHILNHRKTFTHMIIFLDNCIHEHLLYELSRYSLRCFVLFLPIARLSWNNEGKQGD